MPSTLLFNKCKIHKTRVLFCNLLQFPHLYAPPSLWSSNCFVHSTSQLVSWISVHSSKQSIWIYCPCSFVCFVFVRSNGICSLIHFFFHLQVKAYREFRNLKFGGDFNERSEKKLVGNGKQFLQGQSIVDQLPGDICCFQLTECISSNNMQESRSCIRVMPLQ